MSSFPNTPQLLRRTECSIPMRAAAFESRYHMEGQRRTNNILISSICRLCNYFYLQSLIFSAQNAQHKVEALELKKLPDVYKPLKSVPTSSLETHKHPAQPQRG